MNNEEKVLYMAMFLCVIVTLTGIAVVYNTTPRQHKNEISKKFRVVIDCPTINIWQTVTCKDEDDDDQEFDVKYDLVDSIEKQPKRG
jgi:hypothetical protein